MSSSPTGGIGGLPTSAPFDCEAVPPEPNFFVIQNQQCRVDVVDQNSVFDMSSVDQVTIVHSGPGSPLVLNAPFAYPIQTTATSIAISHPDLCEVEITSIEFSSGGDVVATISDGPYVIDEYIEAGALSSPADCTLHITGVNLAEIASLELTLAVGGPLQFHQGQFDSNDGTTIVITDPSLCGVTINEIVLYVGLFTAPVQERTGLNVVIGAPGTFFIGDPAYSLDSTDEVQELIAQVIIAADGGHYVYGTTRQGALLKSTVWKFDADNTLDATWGTGGVTVVDIGNGNDETAASIGELNDGSVLLSISEDFGDKAWLAKLDPNGALDTAYNNGFGNDGFLDMDGFIGGTGKRAVVGGLFIRADQTYDVALDNLDPIFPDGRGQIYRWVAGNSPSTEGQTVSLTNEVFTGIAPQVDIDMNPVPGLYVAALKNEGTGMNYAAKMSVVANTKTLSAAGDGVEATGDYYGPQVGVAASFSNQLWLGCIDPTPPNPAQIRMYDMTTMALDAGFGTGGISDFEFNPGTDSFNGIHSLIRTTSGNVHAHGFVITGGGDSKVFQASTDASGAFWDQDDYEYGDNPPYANTLHDSVKRGPNGSPEFILAGSTLDVGTNKYVIAVGIVDPNGDLI